MNYASDKLFPGHIVRMGLTGKNKLDRAIVVSYEPQQTFRIPKQQITPLVGGKAAGKS